MRDLTRMTRREFVRRVGGGIVVFIAAGPSLLDCSPDSDRRGGNDYSEDINAYLRIAPDGTVTFFSGKIEMGQGVHTSLSQMLAEELRVPLESIRPVMGDTALCPYDRGTWGSRSTRFFGPAVRAAGAQARLVLLALAAEKLGVPTRELTAEDGVVSLSADPRRHVTYGELAQGREISRTVDEKAVLRAVREFSVMGRSPRRLDGRAKVTGAAQYAGDIRLPGMLHARILRPPAHGATMKSVDTSAAARMDGVTVVHDGDLVAALHADPEVADRALAAIEADFDVPAPSVDSETIYDHLVRLAGSAGEHGSRGSLEAGRRDAERTFDQTYLNAYVAHAPMEPHTAVAKFEDGKATVWSSTQSPFGQREVISKHIDIDSENVRVITPFVGGGFGGKSRGLQANEAAMLARLIGKPVQVRWTRAEEFFHDTFRPAAVVKVVSGIDGVGRICYWDYQVFHAGARGSGMLYDVPNLRIRSYDGEGVEGDVHPFATGPWRAPGANTNIFAIEQQIDIMAAAAGIDPLEFRLNNASDPRLVGVLKAAAERYGWSRRPAPVGKGQGRGIACGTDVGTYVAAIAEVTVDAATGKIKVDRVVCAQDMGIVVNPDGATMQMEGCITMGLGYALAEEVRFEGGKLLDTNFDSYQLPRFSWLPRIETVLVKNDGLDPQGGGEPGIIVMGAVVANAVFDAIGVRQVRLPMIPERVKQKTSA
jgi:isoquinoline 1-oxidoreductase